ncbi:beta-L-arabinofuranosidase domain-containing protein [uncultured Bacteroides sp.]|uniref:beta-L-arabinofuranosidase domain-containing protein n=1 Tax=uncultured Bacteroides sp. TaxID=162156 RepID=UPI00280B69E9|nr:beta-L-arabinofuranosidase domain-containing protein [uncultured Bacteroides sp.]
MKNKYTLLVALLVFFQIHSFAQDMFNTGVEKAKPYSNAAVTLRPSWIKQREELNTRFLKSLEPDRLLHNFRVNAGLPSDAQPLEGWEAPKIGLRGHFVGHYLSAISCAVEKYHDAQLAGALNYMIEELYKCQQALGNGYLSAFPEKDFEVLETRYSGVWAPYYTYHKIMQGLLDAYVRTGNKKAYDMVIQMASYVDRRMSRLDARTIEKVLYSVGANPSNEAGAMNEVLYKLYKVSKNPKHLALAKIFDRDWFLIPLSQNQNILSGLHSNTHLVLVNGFAQRYSIMRDKPYYDAVVNFWNMLMKEHTYVNGSSSGPRPNVVTRTSLSAEHWGVPGHLSNTLTKEIAESCVSHNTQKLTSTLFTWEANPIYADVYMNTFYNSILALQSAHTGACVYHLPLGSPRKKAFLKENDFRCCNGSTIEAFALLNSGIYYHNDSTLWVNLYVPSELDWKEKNIRLEQSGEFPMNSSVEFSVSVKKQTAFGLNLFIPSWAKAVDVFVNGEKQQTEITPDSYVSINRKWKNKDKVRLVFHYDFYIKTMPDDKNMIAIFYGPILLAFENGSELILKGTPEDILNGLKVQGDDNGSFTLNNGGRVYSLKPLYAIEEHSYGVYATIRNY